MLRYSKRFCKAPGSKIKDVLATQLNEIKAAGTWKQERVITSPQGMSVTIQGSSKPVLNFCANNYLGFSSSPVVVDAAKKSLDAHGFGMSSVRFICGTHEVHKGLEADLTEWLGTEDTILYPSCFDANAGVFEAILTSEDAVISDSLNHASIIDGVRLCKAQRHRYKHMDMKDLEECLIKSQEKRLRLIVTDGVFSMDGDLAPLDKIVALAEKYDAALMVDDSHATGFMGDLGRGTANLFGVQDKVAVITSTLGKAMGGASGGFCSGFSEVVQIQRQRGRPYLFSNTMVPSVAAGCREALHLIKSDPSVLEKIRRNTKLFRTEMEKRGMKCGGHPEHPIAPVHIGDAKLAADMATKMLEEGIYVIAFSYPVVAKDQARIRVQISSAHTEEQVMQCVNAFDNTLKFFKAQK